MNGKRVLSSEMATRLCNRLQLTPNETESIVHRLDTSRPKSVVLNGKFAARRELDHEIFQVIADWYHYAILQLVRTQEYFERPLKTREAEWFAKQLQITPIEAKLAIDRLVRMNLLSRKNDTLVRTHKQLTTTNKSVTSSAHKKLQKQIREKAIYSLEHHPLEVRSMTSMTMAISSERLMDARSLIDEFQEKLSNLLEGSSLNSVYQLEISLFPLNFRENTK
jgi:uncharacterized protein (TIGR02147 family)